MRCLKAKGYYEELMKTSKIATRVGPLWKHKSKEFPKNIEKRCPNKNIYAFMIFPLFCVETRKCRG